MTGLLWRCNGSQTIYAFVCVQPGYVQELHFWIGRTPHGAWLQYPMAIPGFLNDSSLASRHLLCFTMGVVIRIIIWWCFYLSIMKQSKSLAESFLCSNLARFEVLVCHQFFCLSSLYVRVWAILRSLLLPDRPTPPLLTKPLRLVLLFHIVCADCTCVAWVFIYARV